MAFFPSHKNTTLSTGHSYCYLYQAPAPDNGKPTLLFLHGFPSSAYDFRHQVEHFSARGYGLLVPDLLGYGGTSQPLDVGSYSMTKMASEIAEILDREGVARAVGISHDWGSGLLSALLRQHHARFDAFVFMATYYGAAHPYSGDGDYDYAALKEKSLTEFGFNAFGHTMFLGDAARAGKLLDEHLESFYDLVWARDQELWKTYFRREGGIEEWVTQGKRGVVADWVGGEAEREKIIRSWKMGNGFTPKCLWYKQLLDGVSVADEPDTPITKLSQPILLMIEQRDVKGRGEGAGEAAKAVSQNVFVEKCDTYHFMMLEDAEGTNRKIESFLSDVLGGQENK